MATKAKATPVDTLPRPWPAHVHASKAMTAPMGKQLWQSHIAMFKVAPISKATTAKVRSQDQGIPYKRAARAKAAPVGILPRPRHAGQPK